MNDARFRPHSSSLSDRVTTKTCPAQRNARVKSSGERDPDHHQRGVLAHLPTAAKRLSCAILVSSLLDHNVY